MISLLHELRRRPFEALALLLLAACAAPGAEPTRGTDPDAAPPPFRHAFVDRAEELGVDFRHQSGARGKLRLPEGTGSGVGLVDYDNDGDLDLYLVQGGWLDDRTGELSDRLFHNELVESGRLAFRDATEEAGLKYTRTLGRGYGQGVAVGDFDRDGDQDLFVTAFGPDRLLRNQNGRFEEVAENGWGDDGWSTSALFVDLDLDRWPELFVARYVDYSLGAHKDCFLRVGTPEYCTPLSYNPLPDRLFHNHSGILSDGTTLAGMGEARGNGLGVVAADFDGNQFLDIFVANDQMANFLWINDGALHFREEGALAGVALSAEGVAEGSMGVVVLDFDHDGNLDLLMTHLKGESHTLYQGLGAALFEDATDRALLTGATLAATGFGVAAVDFDNDGWSDLAVANGSVHLDPSRPASLSPLPLDEPDQLLRNEGGRFVPVSVAAFEPSCVGRGLAVGDLDGDGDADLVFNDAEGSTRVLINTAGQDQSWLGVELADADGLDPGEGLAVTATVDGSAQTKLRQRGGSYLSSNDPRVLFGLGQETQPVVVSVRWQDGSNETFGPLEVRRYHLIQQGRGRAQPTQKQP